MADEERETEESLKDLGGKIAERLQARRSDVANAIATRINASVPVSADTSDPVYQAGMIAAVTAVLDYCLEAIEHGLEWSGPVPPEAIAQAHRAARAGVNMGTVLRRYVAGQGRFSKFVAEEAEHLGLSSDGLALHHLRRVQERVLERLTAAIEREYVAERERMARPSEHRRIEIVRSLLAKELVEPAELTELGYELNASWHIGVVATGNSTRDVLQRMRANVRCQLLPVSCDDGTVWAWFGAFQRIKTAEIERMLPPQWDGEILAIGGPGRGLDGWRKTHLEAKGAHLRALRKPEQIVRYAESPLLAAALGNETLETWLREFLAPIQARPDGADLLKTLRAYLDSECNCSSAVHIAKVRRQTIGNRVRLAERLLDRPLRTCLAELDVALRLADLLSEE